MNHQEKIRKKKNDNRTDIIIYKREGVLLFRACNESGDVVYCSMAESVLAAVEIKASPSHMLEQKRNYTSDIVRLLHLRSKGIAGFVILDKSSSLYGNPHRELNAINWESFENKEAALSCIINKGHRVGVTVNEWGIY